MSRATSTGVPALTRAALTGQVGKPKPDLLSNLQGLAGVVQRATARGFGAAAKQPEPETWVEGDYRYTRLASGVVVKDSLATAPLR